MKKLSIYAEVFARVIVLLILLVPAAPALLLYVISYIGEFYLSFLLAFVNNTKDRLTFFESLNKQNELSKQTQ